MLLVTRVLRQHSSPYANRSPLALVGRLRLGTSPFVQRTAGLLPPRVRKGLNLQQQSWEPIRYWHTQKRILQRATDFLISSLMRLDEMMERIAEASPRVKARIAGVFHLLNGLTYGFATSSVRGKLLVWRTCKLSRKNGCGRISA